MDKAASPDRALIASPSFSVNEAAATDDALIFEAPPRGRERPCSTPDGEVICFGLLPVAVSAGGTEVVLVEGRSLPTTRSSNDKAFSTA